MIYKGVTMNEHLINHIASKFMTTRSSYEDLDDLKQEARIHVMLHPDKQESTTIMYGLKNHIRHNKAMKRNDKQFVISNYDDTIEQADISYNYDDKLFYQKALSILEERDRYIVSSYCKNIPNDLIAIELNISKQRVSQLYYRAIRKIKKVMGV